MSFRNAQDAGQKLAAALAKYRRQQVTVLALPRGGVPVAAEVAEVLDAPLDLVLVRRSGCRFSPNSPWGQWSMALSR